MKLRGARRSVNIEDRRRGGGRKVAAGGGLLAVAVVVTAMFFPEVRPILDAMGLDRPTRQTTPAPQPGQDAIGDFIAATLGYTEEVWGDVFAAGGFPRAGGAYQPVVLVLFSDKTVSPCGGAAAGNGPFYCPADRRIYIDPAFYRLMAKQLKSPGDFAQAYVIAHEVAHHVQNLNGLLPQINRRRNSVGEAEGNQLNVRLELQADCYAGVWTKLAQQKHDILEKGDLNEALNAAFQVGDDVLQRMGGGDVDAAAFTHGTAEQRKRWFQTGFDQGAVGGCDTFEPVYSAL